MRNILFASIVAAAAIAMPATAAQVVTYTWTTTALGYGDHVSQPSFASFDVPLADVLNGKIWQWDITNIQLTYPGLTFDTAGASSGGMDFAAFVDPTTGAFIYHDADQGLSVFASSSANINTYLSITVDNRYTPFGVPLTSVADQFNALNAGSPYAGWPNAGYWTASFPEVSAAPESSTWLMLLLGFGCTGLMLRGARREAATA